LLQRQHRKSASAGVPVGPNWGRSFEAAKHNQTLNPDADKNLEPVEGIDGPAAERIMREYTEGGKEKQKSGSGLGVLTIQK
jgi:hypothetical protein